jgi:hypothetical protein
VYIGFLSLSLLLDLTSLLNQVPPEGSAGPAPTTYHTHKLMLNGEESFVDSKKVQMVAGNEVLMKKECFLQHQHI